MGVPETASSSGPAKKRQRLSLKKKSDANGQQKAVGVKRDKDEVSENGSFDSAPSSDSLTTSSSTACTESSSSSTCTYTDTASSSRSELRVPDVASLENFGNTCFMNSIMQVLRYTPGFLDNLARIYENILNFEKIRKKLKAPEESKSSDNDLENQKRCWNVAKAIYRVYRDQTLLEEQYEDIASDDVMSMAVKPIKVLQAVRVLNPMYEGCLQHDAQEFLRCFLAYLQDAEKEIQKFSEQIPKNIASKVVVNPVMQKFLQSAKSKGDKAETSQGAVDESDELKPADKAGNQKASDVLMVDKAKVNLITKLRDNEESETLNKNAVTVVGPTTTSNGSVKKDEKMQPKIGSTAENILEKADNDLSELQSANMPTAMLVADTPDEVNVDKRKGMKKRKLIKGHSRQDREFSPYKSAQRNKKANKGSKCSGSMKNNKKSADIAVEEKDTNKKLMQPSIADMYNKTYSKKKRLGMSRSVMKQNSAENLFDELQELQKSSDIKTGNLDNKDMSNDHKSDTNMIVQTADADNCDLSENSTSAGSAKTINKLKSDTCVKDVEDSKTTIFSAFLRAINTGVDDLVETLSDSDDDHSIIHEKINAKHIHESPRRSPRKSNSQMLIPSPVLLNKSVFSKSDTDIKSVKLNLGLDFDKVETTQLKNKLCLSSVKDAEISSSNDSVKDSKIGSIDSPDRIRIDCEVSFKQQNMKQSTDTKIILEPVIKLENCDYVFKNNETSVSASFATRCLTPSKRSPSKDFYSNNYLKQRKVLESVGTENREAMEKALEAMFNSPVKSNSKCDFIEQLFQGTMMLRTRCLLCETSTERQEDFHDISVPVRLEKDESDDEDNNQDGEYEESRCSLLDVIEASTEVEKLQKDNKYFCQECMGYKEAERSIHYDVMPDILTLHLKRFSACSSDYGYVSKINDAVDIPLALPCLRYKCPQSCLRPDHKYKLYGIITHTGVTLSSGHYLAYVRSRPHPDGTANIHQNQETNVKTEPKTVKQASQVNRDSCRIDKLLTTRGKSGIQPKLPSRFDGDFVSDTKVKAFSNIAGKGKKNDILESLRTNRKFDSHWFECDDETIRVFEESEFIDLLSEKQGSLLGTPYLLLYHKSTLC